MNAPAPSQRWTTTKATSRGAAIAGVAWLLLAFCHATAEEPRKIFARFYSSDRLSVAEVFEDRDEVDVTDVNGGNRRTKLSNFDNTVRGAQFYNGNQILTIYVGGPAAGIWPEFFQRKADGIYQRFGVDTETALPKAISAMLPKDFDYARMWISCVDWEGGETAKIRATVSPSHETDDYNDPFIFTFNVVSGKTVEQISTPSLISKADHPGRMLKGNGTGFYVDWTGLIVTAKHVVENEKDLEVVDSDFKRYPATVVATGADDVALLKVDTRPPAIVPIHTQERPSLGTRLCTMGFPQNPEHGGEGSLELSEGVLSAFGVGNGGRQFQFSAPVRPGNSGGALIDDDGALAGVVVAAYDPLKVFVRTGYSAVLMNLAEPTENVLLLLPAGWAQKDAPVFHDRSEANKNLQASTVEVLLFKDGSAAPVGGSASIQPSLAVASGPSVDPLIQKQQILARAQNADQKMTEVYTSLRSRLNSGGKAQLKDLQLKWLKARAAQTGSGELLAKGASADLGALRRFAEMDEARTAALQALLQSTH